MSNLGIDPLRFDRRPTEEVINDRIPWECKRWKREMREVNIKRVAKGYDTL